MEVINQTSTIQLYEQSLSDAKTRPSLSSWSKNSRWSFRKRKSSPLDAKAIHCKKNEKEKYKPVAGLTSIKIENATDPATDKDGNVLAAWREVDPSTLPVRGATFMTDKVKVPSPGDLYRCVKVDVFESQKRYPDMADRVVLPKVEFDGDDQPKTWSAPDTFVITVALPTDPPSLTRGNYMDGSGYTVTMYYVMHQDTRDILRKITTDGYDPESEKDSKNKNRSKVNATRLLEKWCKTALTDNDFLSRFKVLPRAENIDELGLPRWISRFNGTPFLVKRPGQTGFLFTHPEQSCMEFDISLHPFPYLAKKGICYMKDSYFKKTVTTFAFYLEGRDEDELPECILGAFQLCYPDPIHAVQAEDFFAGTSKTSI